MSNNNHFTAYKIVEAILKDFTDRRGLRQEWEQIDEDVKKEIKDKWLNLSLDILKASTTIEG